MFMKRYFPLFLCLSVLISPQLLTAQDDFKTTTAMFGNLKARQIGPAVMSGRVSCLAVVPGEPEIAYIGAAGGGVWKTVSAGGQVRPIFDDHTQSIGAIAIAPSETETVWVGTGEPWPRNSVSIGTGLYKSTDGGEHWRPMGLDDSERIADIVIHPTNPDIVYVAALGHLWDSNEERGVFKTTDGGQSWEKVLYIDEHTGAADLSLDVNNPEVLYTAMWSFRRRPWTFDSGFNGNSGLYKTSDGGANWEKLSNGLPAEKLGRIAVAVAPSNSQRVYASVETGTEATKGFYRSNDGGASWEMSDQSFNTYVRPFYFSELEIDPSNDTIVAKCGYNGIISEDAGHSFRMLDNRAHPDFHDIWINPDNGKHMRIATDGGVFESFDRGASFKMWMNLPISQFYHVSVDMEKPYRVYGGLQDNGSWFAPSSSPGGISNADWQKSYGGDGFYSFRHPTKDHIIFSEYQGGNLVRYDERNRLAKTIKPYPRNGEAPLRFNWNSPVGSSTDGQRLYFAAQYLFRSEDLGDSWERISPDLTTNNPAYQQQHLSGGLSIDNSTAENYTTIYTFAEAPQKPGHLWVGTDDGRLHLSPDGGNNWRDLTANLPQLPPHAWITFIEPSPHDINTAFVTVDAHRNGDMQPYLYRTTDGGNSWVRLQDDNLSGYALSVRQDLENPDLLFLGTEFGLFISLDNGISWAPFRNNLPPVGIRDMVIHPRESDLVLATHGRGVIIIDDLETIRQIKPETIKEKVTFLNAPPTYFYNSGVGDGDFSGSGNFFGSNPNRSVRIVYYAQKRHTFGKMYIEIFKDGELIRKMPAGKSAGLNVVTIPTKLPKPKTAPTRNRIALIGTAVGPTLPAGEYQVKLTKGKEVFETSFTLSTSPDDLITAADRLAQREAHMEMYSANQQLAYIYDVLKTVENHSPISESQKMPNKLQTEWESLTDEAARMKNQLVALGGDGYTNEGTELREEIGNLYYTISTYPGKPSASQLAEVERLTQEMSKLQSKFEDFLNGPVTLLNTKLEKRKLSPVSWLDYDTFLAQEDEVESASSSSTSAAGTFYLKKGPLRRGLEHLLSSTPMFW